MQPEETRMRRLLSLFAFILAATFSLPAAAEADHLDGVVPLARDDIAAVAQVRAKSAHHVMLYFGDHLN
jgi:hypothetical protein